MGTFLKRVLPFFKPQNTGNDSIISPSMRDCHFLPSFPSLFSNFFLREDTMGDLLYILIGKRRFHHFIVCGGVGQKGRADS